ncbi:MAG: O-methyltransferase [Gemmataceae bacterium]
MMVGRVFPISDYGYVSMGGSYLEDFRVVYNALGIRAMMSFDSDAQVLSRQLLNRPFGFIRCELGTSTEIVNQLAEKRAELVPGEENIIIWLDYTSGDRATQLADIEAVSRKLIAGDVLRVTLNAARQSLCKTESYQAAKINNKIRHNTIEQVWLERLENQLGKYFPASRRATAVQSDAMFAQTLAQSVTALHKTGFGLDLSWYFTLYLRLGILTVFKWSQ